MGSINRVFLVGNLGKDAELRYVPNGSAVANFSVATTETWKDKSGVKQEKTEWSRIAYWGKGAEAIAEYLTKGKSVAVEGKLQTREFEKDGIKRYATEIHAHNVVLLGGGTGQAAGARRPQADRTTMDDDGRDDPGAAGQYGVGPVEDDIPF